MKQSQSELIVISLGMANLLEVAKLLSIDIVPVLGTTLCTLKRSADLGSPRIVQSMFIPFLTTETG